MNVRGILKSAREIARVVILPEKFDQLKLISLEMAIIQTNFFSILVKKSMSVVIESLFYVFSTSFEKFLTTTNFIDGVRRVFEPNRAKPKRISEPQLFGTPLLLRNGDLNRNLFPIPFAIISFVYGILIHPTETIVQKF